MISDSFKTLHRHSRLHTADAFGINAAQSYSAEMGRIQKVNHLLIKAANRKRRMSRPINERVRDD